MMTADGWCPIGMYRQTSNISPTWVGDEIVDHSNVVGACRHCSNYIFTPGLNGFCRLYEGTPKLLTSDEDILREVMVKGFHNFTNRKVSHVWYILEALSNGRFMMTLSNGNIFRVTGHLCGEVIGPQWIPLTKASDVELCYFLWFASE